MDAGNVEGNAGASGGEGHTARVKAVVFGASRDASRNSWELVRSVDPRLPVALRQLLEEISSQVGERRYGRVILLNGRSIGTLDAEKTLLRDGDEISFLPFVGGG